MHTALTALNSLVADGVLPSYSIGGAIGASFYLEAHATDDLDVFAQPGCDRAQLVLDCEARGGVAVGVHICFGTWPVQILEPDSALVEEALRLSIETDFDGIPTRVMTAEHLCAICIATCRPKDFVRASSLLEQNQVDIGKLKDILQRFNLIDHWSLVPATATRQELLVPTGLQDARTGTPQELLERFLVVKAGLRLQARAKPWPEKLAIIERLRDTTSMARDSMRKTKAACAGAATASKQAPTLVVD